MRPALPGELYEIFALLGILYENLALITGYCMEYTLACIWCYYYEDGLEIYIYVYIYGNLVGHAEECNYCLRLTHVQWYVQPFSHSVLKGNIWNEIETTGI